MASFKITFDSERGEASTEVEVDADMIQEANSNDYEILYPFIVRQARKNVASRFVDYESFKSDSAYAERLEEVGKEFNPESVDLISDLPTIRYSVLTRYRHGGESYSDWVFASTHEEAEFKARWVTAVNEGAEPGELEEFSEHLESVPVDECYSEPVTKEELVGTLQDLLAVCKNAGLTGAAVNAAKEQLRLMGHEA